MKVLLTALNAKYIHSSLSLRYLQTYSSDLDCEIELKEFNINQSLEYIIAEIWRTRAQVIGFSCYIWNREQILKICQSLKRIEPELFILLGGPEVSFNTEEILQQNTAVDCIVRGEGEETFKEILELLIDLSKEGSVQIGHGLEWTMPGLASIQGISYRQDDQIVVNPDRELMDLEDIPAVYSKLGLAGLENKLVYLETSRGCPFNCEYCISSTTRGVRFFPLEVVKEELECLVTAGVETVKFVDRTFNCQQQRAREIMEWIIELDKVRQGETRFHLEVNADIINDELLKFMLELPSGLFQLEIGVQSTNQETLRAINRRYDLKRLKEVVSQIGEKGNIHQHLDLIAGLPDEDYRSFALSFDEVFKMRPDRLQLGFLKLLPGSALRRRAEEYGYQYNPYPPYQVISNNVMSFADLLKLKLVEEMVETFYNSKRFTRSLEWLLRGYDSPFAFFGQLSRYWQERGYHHQAHKVKRLYNILSSFACQMLEQAGEGRSIFLELLKYDYLCHRRSLQLPGFFFKVEVDDYKERFWSFITDQKNLEKYLPHYQGLNPRRIGRKVQIEPLAVAIEQPEKKGEGPYFYLFDYGKRNPVTALPVVQRIKGF